MTANNYSSLLKYISMMKRDTNRYFQLKLKKFNLGGGQQFFLLRIAENPGINISELAAMWNRTNGAISQTATKLEKSGYIIRRKQPGNKKFVELYPTEKGITLSQAHMRYDAIEVSKTMNQLLNSGCTASEIDTFFKVVEKYCEILLN